MRVGVISDLHSNIYALKALTNRAENIDVWICLGDFVGLFPNVNEVVDYIRLNSMISVKGDHEFYLLNDEKMEYSFTGNQSIEFQRKTITRNNLKFIQNLNETISIEIDGLKFFCTHFLSQDHNNRNRTGKYTIDLKVLDKKYDNYDVVLWGHSHLPAAVCGKKTIYLNPGSAGFPIDVIKKPSFLIYDTSTKTFQFEHFTFEIENLLRDIQAFGYNQKLYNYLKSGFVWR